MPIPTYDRSVYQFALQHLEKRRDELDGLIANVRLQTGTRTTKGAEPDSSGPDWVLSASERAPRTKPVRKPRRKMSAEGKARLVAALKKRWAAFHAKTKKTDATEPVTKKSAKAAKKT